MSRVKSPGRATAVLMLSTLVSGVAMADAPIRHGNKLISESTLLEKTANGREFRRIRTEYNWDDGLVYNFVYDKAGVLVATRVSHNGLRPDAQELERAFALVWDDPQIRAIRRQQAGLEVNGGFTYRAKQGACALPARCVQVFLFDGENVVKHMLVDLRVERIVDYDYVPPINKGVQQ